MGEADNVIFFVDDKNAGKPQKGDVVWEDTEGDCRVALEKGDSVLGGSEHKLFNDGLLILGSA